MEKKSRKNDKEIGEKDINNQEEKGKKRKFYSLLLSTMGVHITLGPAYNEQT